MNTGDKSPDIVEPTAVEDSTMEIIEDVDISEKFFNAPYEASMKIPAGLMCIIIIAGHALLEGSEDALQAAQMCARQYRDAVDDSVIDDQVEGLSQTLQACSEQIVLALHAAETEERNDALEVVGSAIESADVKSDEQS